jgi:glutamate-5-semialdehyde dehydrogenase
MTTTVVPELIEKAQRAKRALPQLAALTRAQKDRILLAMAKAVEASAAAILEANARDVARAQERGSSATPVDRLILNEKRMAGLSQALRDIAAFADPVGEVISRQRRPNGLEITKVRVPLGVVGFIYESRPNITVDAAGLCLKSGNAVVLRGGSDAIDSNTILATVLKEAGAREGMPEGAVEMIESTDRAIVGQMLGLDEYIDVIIPRGGHEFIRRARREATVPIIETGEGNCHVYVDAAADLDMAENIVENAKCQRPSVCNAAETLLVHAAVADEFLPRVGRRLTKCGVELRADERARPLIAGAIPATEEDWSTEYLALIMAVKVVDSVEEAISHINRYGTNHSDAIVTRDSEVARRFTHEVDSAAVYVNASTRFTDGGEFGMGAEMGISNRKIHARGPVGLAELTSYKYVVVGEGHVRG